MNKYKKRLLEIAARRKEIRSQLVSDADVSDEVLTALNDELAAMETETEQIKERMRILEGLTEDDGEDAEDAEPEEDHEETEPRRGLRSIDKTGIQKRAKTGAASDEYMDAWARTMLGQPVSQRSREVYDKVNAEHRAFTHTTENTGVLIPETVVAGIWKRAAEVYSLWNDVRKFNVPGTLTMKKHVGIKAGDAAWYDEPTEVVDEENEFAEISLFGCELAKSVTVSWKLKAMAIADFIPFLEREVGERMGVALGTAAYSGKGKPGGSDSFKPEPRGIKTALLAQSETPQVVEYSTALKESDLRAVVAKLHSSYIAGAAWYANNNTVWTTLAGIQDANKRSILLSDVAVEGAVGRIFGKPVKVDSAIADGEVLFGDPQSGYWANINKAMTMHTEDHVKKRETDYMGYAIVDGDVYDEMAFALLMPATTP